MPISAKQLNFCDVSTDFDKFYYQNQDDLLSLLNQFINISDFIPFYFYQKFYSHFGTKRDFSLESMLNAFILKNILSIPIHLTILLLKSPRSKLETEILIPNIRQEVLKQSS